MEVTIERILPGGFGLAHAEGKTVMVALAAPGDRLRVRIDRVKGSVAFASIEEIIESSRDRVEPPCPYFGRCGGCDFQQLNYQAQLAAKIEIIKDCLHRIGKIANVPEFEIIPAPNEWHYRARAQWQYDAERKRLGYFEGGSRRVCDVAECAVLVPELQATLENLRAQIVVDAVPHDARYFRAIAGDDSVSIAPSVRSPIGGEGNVREVRRSIGSESYTLTADNFFQANTDLLPRLINGAIGDASGERAIELYCGVGLFTLPLAHRFKHVIAVEDDAEAASFALMNLANSGLMNAEIEKSNVARWLEANLECAGDDGALDRVDFLLLDPPRTGAESRVIGGILQLRPRQISYVSCDPATLARDLKKLIAGGFSLDSIVAFDMFPQTHHVETVAHLIASKYHERLDINSNEA
ncbi:MAG TPA: class I SAM-dependent RNA methyltransferase [Pyrinomonadaceae bacterium]|nr:class I SAM-dependent RNA methyltransferase [Pyrinomonadaceae bacterium]